MSISVVDLRFLSARGLSLLRRGLTSLRTRGWRASWQRVKLHFQRAPRIRHAGLYQSPHAPLADFSVPHAPEPRASIVIPVYNQFAHTLACLRALAAHPPAATCEIIVVDDGSSDQTVDALPRIDGLRYHRRPDNGGFVAACNDGAALATGEFLVFLNNDTVPQPGWLDALLHTFDEHPQTGLVGAQLLYPDGRLQEAGGLVFADGSGWNYGRFQSPHDPRFSFVRDADYCSGAATAIPRALFASLGGFDTRYAPAYYEDTALAFAVRDAGFKVLYQPAARVVHDEGTTAGTDIGSGVKAFQPRNRKRFVEQWSQALAAQPDITTPDVSTAVHGRRQILVIDALTPDAGRDSGSLRLLNLMRLLRDQGAHVVFLPADRRHVDNATRILQQLGVETWHTPWVKRIPAWLREHGPRFDSVLLCRHYVASEFLPLLRRHAPQARIVFDTVDLHYLREQRGAAVSNDPALQRNALRTRALELDVIAGADTTLVVSHTERDLLAQDAPQAHVEVLSNLHQIAGSGQPFAQRRDLVFVGGFRHPPNVDAVRWFVDDVFPRVRASLPDIQFHCVGSDVPPSIQALANQPGVRIHGHVPDITPCMDGKRVAVAPLRYGAGVKGKINLSMAHGQPVVATACAVEGMHLSDGVDVLVADDARTFADAVLRLYRDENLWQALSDNGLKNVEQHFSLAAGREPIRRVFFAH